MTTQFWNNLNADIMHTYGGSGGQETGVGDKLPRQNQHASGETMVPTGTNSGFGRMIAGIGTPFPGSIGDEAKALIKYGISGPSGFFGPEGALAYQEIINANNPSMKGDPIQQLGSPIAEQILSMLPEAAGGSIGIAADTGNAALKGTEHKVPKPLKKPDEMLQSLLRAFGSDPYNPSAKAGQGEKEKIPDVLMEAFRDAILEGAGIYSKERVRNIP
jgi:hypothetical protein